MGSKSKRRHAQKQYNRAQNKPVAAAEPVAVTESVAPETVAAPIMTAKDVRRLEKERQKNEKKIAREQAKQANNNAKSKPKDPNKKPFFLIRFFRWIGRTCAEIGSELKKVHWPTFKQIIKATGIVLGIVVGFGILLLGIWAVLGWLHGLLIGG